MAKLEVHVPEAAIVYFGETRTITTGTVRRYESTRLRPGQVVKLQVRAEIIRDGRKVQQQQTIDIRAGAESSLAFNFDEEETETTLTLQVPPDARVFLGNYEKAGNGTVRYFSTKRIETDDQISDYPVRVSVIRDGQMISQERKISLKAGDSKKLVFEFDRDPRVAGQSYEQVTTAGY